MFTVSIRRYDADNVALLGMGKYFGVRKPGAVVSDLHRAKNSLEWHQVRPIVSG
jgi:hypothetical protein